MTNKLKTKTKNLSEGEAYILSLLNYLNKDKELGNADEILFGLYLAAFLCVFENRKDNIIKKIESLQQETRLRLVIEKFANQKLLQIKKDISFGGFIINDVFENKFIDSVSKTLSEVMRPISSPKKCSSRFDRALFKKKNHANYEMRFFWPSHLFPEIYDLFGLIFNKKYYTHVQTNDKYILIEDNVNLNVKIRKNELQIKKCIQKINNISYFKKKKKIIFPMKLKNHTEIFGQKIFFDLDLIKTPEELFMKLSHFPGISCIDVIKKRYVRKVGKQVKIDFSSIKIQKQEWKTISIESKSLPILLGLSLLIAHDDAEKLTYEEFLQKYGKQES